MKKIILICMLIGMTNYTFAQSMFVSTRISDSTTANSNARYFPTIPSIINGSNFIPSSSNININPTASDISLKIGFPGDDKINIKNGGNIYGFFQPEVKAVNGITTLYSSSNNSSINGSITAGGSIILLDTTALVNKKSHHFILPWINIIANIQRITYNLFNENAKYNNMLTKQNATDGSIILSGSSIIHLFDHISKDQKTKHHYVIVSFGGGYAWFDNYSSLKPMTLESGSPIVSNSEGDYQTLVSSTAGAEGILNSYTGLTGDLELYYNLIAKSSANGSDLYLGGRALYYKAVTSSNSADLFSYCSVSGGLFLALNKASNTNYSPNIGSYTSSSKNTTGLSLTVQYNNKFSDLNNSTTSGNLAILLGASIPLKF